MTDPYLSRKLWKTARDKLADIREGKIRMPHSWYLVGVPDWTGSLEEGQAHPPRMTQRFHFGHIGSVLTLVTWQVLTLVTWQVLTLVTWQVPTLVT